VKRLKTGRSVYPAHTFSILERIDVGETFCARDSSLNSCSTFSILERIDVGETEDEERVGIGSITFSILERIDVGETSAAGAPPGAHSPLSVSSNGSTWVKQARAVSTSSASMNFQYPRTDRRG